MAFKLEPHFRVIDGLPVSGEDAELNQVVKKHGSKAMKASDAIEYLKKKDPNMPVFCLLAQDALADEAVERWAIRARASGVNNDKVQEAMLCAEEMLRWPNRKMPD